MLPNHYSQQDGFGVRRDTLIDARIETDHAQSVLKSAAVELDGVADTTEGIWTDEELAEIRSIQQRLHEIAEGKEADIEHINTELVAIKQQQYEADQ